ncbi:MAG: alkylmercury lyase [Mycobacterium sp.]
MRVQLLHVPDCPLMGRLRHTLDDCLRHVGFAVRVEELEGSCPSPTLVIDGIDVATGAPPSREICCRFDLPTCAQIATALNRAARARGGPAAISREPRPSVWNTF